ncbi:MAG: hypothetical protein AAF587_28695 [Bacteroidota bacterium]
MSSKKDKTKALLGNLNLGAAPQKERKKIAPVQKETQNREELKQRIKEELKAELEPKLPAPKKIGRKRDWDEEVPLSKSTFKIPTETFYAMRQALVSSHKSLRSQNIFINEAIRAYLGLDEE